MLGPNAARWLRFVVTGGFVTASSFLFFVALLRVLKVPTVPAYVLAYAFGVVLGYLVNSAWTFERRQPRSWAQLLAYTLVHCLMAGLSTALIHVETAYWGWLPELGAIANTFLNAVLGYFLMQKLVFSPRFSGRSP